METLTLLAQYAISCHFNFRGTLKMLDEPGYNVVCLLRNLSSHNQ